ncbi:nucleotide exchange factor GrpE [Luteolibacter flavescens]|uniref:Protein GrpE n=1 Tax=Luteolibacter flavescens TaxID=1859460 RepID=A0ABT3FLD5_9BACT|nr:nucleotide exchange factor GrpE [Luteolibacter flavescens]MCW1884379.1 nucleotide exchange factor GrpE [Luteolibacter flavescens]
MIPEDEKDTAAGVEDELPDGTPADTDPYSELEADVLKWKELAVRTAADLDNFRKRSAREREEAMRYANQGLLEDLMPVIDNFEMGMMAAAQDKSSMIYIGMDMVRRQLNDFLSAQGVTEIPAEGKVFDPNVHEAISQEDCAAEQDGKVLRVNRRGFMLRDRLLRPAVVVVGKVASPETDGEEG